jgi:putative endonuclease
MGSNQILGQAGEDAVGKFLINQGIQILDRNWRSKTGEIDLIAIDKSGIVRFIEVKTRSSLRFGDPLESINKLKAVRLQKLAREWMFQNKIAENFQIDCASVLVNQGNFEIDFREKVL